MATFLELQSQVLERLEEVSTVSIDVFTLPELKAAINEGYADLSERTEWNETSETVSVSTQYVDILDSATIDLRLLSIKKIYNQSTGDWLRWIDVKRLDAFDYRWDTKVGAPEWMFLRGVAKLGFYPVPTAATNMDIFYTKMPTPLSADGDTPAFPDAFHRALMHYGAYDLLSQDGETLLALQEWNEYRRMERMFVKWMADRLLMARTQVYGSTINNRKRRRSFKTR